MPNGNGTEGVVKAACRSLELMRDAMMAAYH
jgi:hypothetical protein